MPTANLRIVPKNDFDDATLSVNVTLPAGFEAEKLQNPYRDDVLRTTGTSTLVVTGVLPANRVANCFHLFRHLLAGASLRMQLFTDTGASAAASGGDSGTNAALWYTATEAYTFSTGTNDPFQLESPFRYYFAAPVTYRSFKLTVSGTPSAVGYFQISRAWVGKYFEFTSPIAWGMQGGLSDLGSSARTEGGTRRSLDAEVFRTLQFEAPRLTEAERGTLMQIMRTAKTTREIVVDGFPDDATSKGRDHLMDGYFTSLDSIGRTSVNFLTKRFQIEEA